MAKPVKAPAQRLVVEKRTSIGLRHTPLNKHKRRSWKTLPGTRKTMMEDAEFLCSICQEACFGYGNNAAPRTRQARRGRCRREI
jgi:hypothetical protein